MDHPHAITDLTDIPKRAVSQGSLACRKLEHAGDNELLIFGKFARRIQRPSTHPLRRRTPRPWIDLGDIVAKTCSAPRSADSPERPADRHELFAP
jgi:hypothetical protein